MNAITLLPPGGVLSPRMQQAMQSLSGQSEFSANVSGGYAVMSIKGKVFRIKHKGTETPLFRPGTMEPAASITVVMLKANPQLSKLYYESGFKDGSAEAPECWSGNGVTPDAAAAKKQSPTCAACPRNVWGSKINEATGKQAKECQDSRRVAIVPAAETWAPGADAIMRNEVYGGPVLLRVPAATLSELAAYDTKVKALGFPTYGVVTRISFDYKLAYPKLQFEPVRLLGPDEDAVMWALREDARVETMLSTEQVDAAPAPVGAANNPLALAAQMSAQEQALMLTAYASQVQPAVPVAPVAPVAPAIDPQLAAFQAWQAQQAAQAAAAAEAKAKADAEAAEAARFAAWQAQQQAEAEAKAKAEAEAKAKAAAAQVPAAPPGIDPAVWATFMATQASLATPAVAPVVTQTVAQATVPATEPAAPKQAAKPRKAPAATIPQVSAPPAPPADAQPTPAVVAATPGVDELLAGLNIT